MLVIIDDNLTPATGVYTTILMGAGACGFAVTPPRTGWGTEIFRVPAAGNGGGQSVLHSRMNVALHPLGFSFAAASVAGDSPSMAELATGCELDALGWTQGRTARIPHQQVNEFPCFRELTGAMRG